MDLQHREHLHDLSSFVRAGQSDAEMVLFGFRIKMHETAYLSALKNSNNIIINFKICFTK